MTRWAAVPALVQTRTYVVSEPAASGGAACADCVPAASGAPTCTDVGAGDVSAPQVRRAQHVGTWTAIRLQRIMQLTCMLCLVNTQVYHIRISNKYITCKLAHAANVI
jgi:hypothetical protein